MIANQMTGKTMQASVTPVADKTLRRRAKPRRGTHTSFQFLMFNFVAGAISRDRWAVHDRIANGQQLHTVSQLCGNEMNFLLTFAPRQISGGRCIA